MVVGAAAASERQYVMRLVFTLSAAFSALVGVAALALWVASCFAWPRTDYSWFDTQSGTFTGWVVNLVAGKIGVTYTRSWMPIVESKTTRIWYTVPMTEGLPMRDRLGLSLPSWDYRDKPFGDATAMRYWNVYTPCWLLLLLSVPILFLWLCQRRRTRRRRMQGKCVGCGYDLRATRERCPECGLAITVGKAAAA